MGLITRVCYSATSAKFGKYRSGEPGVCGTLHNSPKWLHRFICTELQVIQHRDRISMTGNGWGQDNIPLSALDLDHILARIKFKVLKKAMKGKLDIEDVETSYNDLAEPFLEAQEFLAISEADFSSGGTVYYECSYRQHFSH